MPAPPAFSPASTAFWNSPAWNSAQAASTLSSFGSGSASPACRRAHCLLQRRGVVGVVGAAVREGGPFGHRCLLVVLSSRQRVGCRCRRRPAPCRCSRCAGFEIGQQQAQHMEGAAQQRRAGALGLERPARVAHVLVAQPVGQHHHHRGARPASASRRSMRMAAARGHAVEHRAAPRAPCPAARTGSASPACGSCDSRSFRSRYRKR